MIAANKCPAKGASMNSFPVLALFGLLGFCFIVIVIMINSLIYKKNSVNNSFATVDVLLKKRFDMIPNLVETVKGYASHEAGLFKEITELRARTATGGENIPGRLADASKMSGLLGRLMMTVENYPELKANEGFLQLQRSINEIEEQISAARRAFNAAVNEYNNAVQMFPTSLLANMLGYETKQYFTASAGDRENVNVGEILKK